MNMHWKKAAAATSAAAVCGLGIASCQYQPAPELRSAVTASVEKTHPWHFSIDSCRGRAGYVGALLTCSASDVGHGFMIMVNVTGLHPLQVQTWWSGAPEGVVRCWEMPRWANQAYKQNWGTDFCW